MPRQAHTYNNSLVVDEYLWLAACSLAQAKSSYNLPNTNTIVHDNHCCI
jgi:uncharacterized lipoprotein YmbA